MRRLGRGLLGAALAAAAGLAWAQEPPARRYILYEEPPASRGAAPVKFIDLASVTREGDQVTVEVLWVLRQPRPFGSKTMSHALMVQRFDCVGQTVVFVSVNSFDPAGQSLGIEAYADLTPRPIPQGAGEESALMIACSGAAPQGASELAAQDQAVRRVREALGPGPRW